MKDAMISQEYRDNIEALAADPIVQAMEKAVPKDIDLEAWNFIRGADEEYQRRGGKTERTHVGVVAHAIAKLREGST